ncbi:MAG TPA: hypothetical protein VOA41_18945 [Candidatus Dormibacteraeota bacterium]|nr:hypothetical protein [Candidatus Dormibacteraeota bacterium]
MKTHSAPVADVAAGLGLVVLAAPAYFMVMAILRHQGPGFGLLGQPVVLLGALSIALAGNALSILSLRFERTVPPQLRLSVALRPWNLGAILLALLLLGILLGYVFLENLASFGSRIHAP